MIERKQKGQEGSKQEEFMQLLMPLYERLEQFAQAMTQSEDQAYDLVGETILRAYESFEALRDRQAFLSYLFSIAARLYKRQRRRRGLFGPFDPAHAETLSADTPQPDLGPDITALYEALAHLPAKGREAVVLFELCGFSLNDILEIQGGSLSALKVRLHRSRRRLARLLGVENIPEPTAPVADRTAEERPSSNARTITFHPSNAE